MKLSDETVAFLRSLLGEAECDCPPIYLQALASGLEIVARTIREEVSAAARIEEGEAMKLTPAQAAKLGIVPAKALRPGTHEGIVAAYSDELVQAVIDDLGKRNLRDQRDHEVRWCAERCSAARHERTLRKARGTWTIEKPKKTPAK